MGRFVEESCLILHTVVLISQVGTAYNTRTPITKFLSLGTNWLMYIEKHTSYVLRFHLCAVDSCTNPSPATLTSIRHILKLWTSHQSFCDISNTSGLVLPKNVQVLVESNSNKPLIWITGQSKLCGVISSMYSYQMPSTGVINNQTVEDNWKWYLQVHEGFLINVTLTSLKVFRLYELCETARAAVLDMKTENIIGTLCPGNAASSFYSSGNGAVVLLHTAKAYRQFLIKNTFCRPFATLSFAYQIMDRDLTFDLSLVTGTVGLHDYFTYTFHHLDIDDHSRIMMKARRLDKHFLVHKYMQIVYNMPHLSHLFESKGIFIYFFRFQAILGARHSIVNGSLECKDD